ncbi:MAG: PQQ-dependent sugar dehydrogenase [Chloroflexota bacterium]
MLHHHFVKAARRRSRFQVAAIVTALALIGGAGPAAGSAARPASDAAAAPAAFNPSAFNLVLTPVAGTLSSPVLVTHAGDGSGRLFVVEQTGKIRVIKGGTLLAAPFLSVSASISTGGERGLLGLAFHPKFKDNGKFYVNMTLKGTGATAINEYRAVGNADTVDWRTGRRIMTIAQPYSNHNGGHLAFGPDGYLYIGMGDGGSAGDPGNRAQNLNSLLGKMLRINPNLTSGSRNYAIPRTNPYVGKTGLDEIWARGLRNPWRFSFDTRTGGTGDLWIGDVGQNRWEEIDVSRRTTAHNAGWGANYGWRIMEGRACFNPSRCSTTGKVRPVAVYGHAVSGADNCSVTGGYVSRGPDALLLGGYLYGDFCSGRIWGLDAAAPSSPALLADTALMISSFGEDEAGNLYVVSLGGLIYRLSATAK